MTEKDFRRLALGLNGAVEAAHMGHPDFRVNGRIFATLKHDGRAGMVKLTPAAQQEFIDRDPAVFEPESGAWGRQGCTRVHLADADVEAVGEALTIAWRAANATPPSKAKRSTTRKKTRNR